MIYSIVFYGKELTCHEVADLSVSFNRHASSIGLKQHHHFLDHVIRVIIYLEFACHDERNGSQSFKIGGKIAKLW